MIDVRDLTVRAGGFRLEGISFRVPAGAYGILMGRTGSGKTTILESLCGLRAIERGAVRLDGTDVTRARPPERGIGYVPQDGALFPTLTVRQHLAFALKYHRWPRAEARRRVEGLAQLLGITHLLDRKPKGLSGGERQRVALGRALSFRPRILCLDEPISSLDDDTRAQMVDLLSAVQKEEQVTTLHVTHSIAEAQSLGSMLLRLEKGAVERMKGFEPAETPGDPDR